jgi:hypothetical protein
LEKLIFLLWGDPAAGDDVRDALLRDVAPRIVDGGAHGLTVNVHDSAAADAPSPVPTPEGEDPHIAEVSVWLDCYERRAGVEAALDGLALRRAGYLVVESLYDDYGTTAHAPPRDWPDGERSPGVLTVALIHRPAGLEYAEWIERWHGTQSPVSGELQPRTRYVRNEVVRALTPGAPEVHGIVEEGWPSANHVADPYLFFNAPPGDGAALTANVERMMASVGACLDLDRIRSTTMTEHLLLTPFSRQ